MSTEEPNILAAMALKPVARWSPEETPASWVTLWGALGGGGDFILTQVIVIGRERNFRWHEI